MVVRTRRRAWCWEWISVLWIGETVTYTSLYMSACFDTVHKVITQTLDIFFPPSQLMFCRAGFALMERHVDTSGRRWVRKFPTCFNDTKHQAAKMAFFLFFTSLLCAPSFLALRGFSVSTDNRVHVFKPVSVQAMWWVTLRWSYDLIQWKSISAIFLCKFVYLSFKCSSWNLKHIPAICLKVSLSVMISNSLLFIVPSHLHTRRSALQSLHKACEVARCHNYFPGSLFLTWVSYYQSRVSSDQVRINEWNAMQDVQSHRADSPVLFSDM